MTTVESAVAEAENEAATVIDEEGLVEADKPKPPVVNPSATLANATESITSQIKYMTDRLEAVEWSRKNILPKLPADIDFEQGSYAHSSYGVELRIPEVEGRPWRQVAMIIYRTRKALGIEKLTRTVNAHSKNAISNQYRGQTGPLPGRELGTSITIYCGSQLPTTCEVKWEEEEIPEEQIQRVRVVGKVHCK